MIWPLVSLTPVAILSLTMMFSTSAFNLSVPPKERNFYFMRSTIGLEPPLGIPPSPATTVA